MLVGIQEAHSLFVDGTFYTSPGLWDQLYFILCLSGATGIPAAFALMLNRTKATYKNLFNQLSSVVEKLHRPTFRLQLQSKHTIFFQTVRVC